MLALDDSFQNLEIKCMIDNGNTVILARYSTPLHSVQEDHHGSEYLQIICPSAYFDILCLSDFRGVLNATVPLAYPSAIKQLPISSISCK
jgi:hypothetical protein